MQPPSTKTVGLVVAVTAVLTLFHFTDNAVNLDTYPGPAWQPDWFEWVVVLAWPIYLTLGIVGYLRYRDGRFPSADAFLVAYSFIGLVSIGHFFYASPDELTTRGAISVFVDIVAGSIVLAVALWSILARRRTSTTVSS
jgi:hypothetical protein